jgi:transposase
MKQKRFPKEFEEGAVRLLRTSGRTKRDIAEGLGVSPSTLTRWLPQGGDREMDEPDRRSQGEHAAAEVKRRNLSSSPPALFIVQANEMRTA